VHDSPTDAVEARPGRPARLGAARPGDAHLDGARRPAAHPEAGHLEAAHLEAAHLEAARRRVSQRRFLRPLQAGVVLIVVIPGLLSHPGPGVHGEALGVTLGLVAFVAGMAAASFLPICDEAPLRRILALLVVGGAGVALAALQPQAASELPAGAAVLMASIQFPPKVASVVTVPVTVGAAVAIGSDADGGTVAAVVLLCVVLMVLGALVRQSRESRDRTELLLAELEAARDDQARAAAVEERSRIARELHDVLAHSLSGLAIQLEGARKLAGNSRATAELQAVLDRSAALAKQGLVEARGAVGALRDSELMTVERLPELVEHYRRDLGLPVDFAATGSPRALPADVSLTLYRVAGEALTNVVRHAAGAPTRVVLTWTARQVALRVANGATADPPAAMGERDDDGEDGGGDGGGGGGGGGWGLVGMRERVSRVGGRCEAGPDEGGWSVVVTVPA
jgi:signal transduction histidine kinase